MKRSLVAAVAVATLLLAAFVASCSAVFSVGEFGSLEREPARALTTWSSPQLSTAPYAQLPRSQERSCLQAPHASLTGTEQLSERVTKATALHEAGTSLGSNL